MATTQIDTATLKTLKQDAKLSQAIRKAHANGADVALARPQQNVQIHVTGATRADSKAIQAAFATVLQ